MTLIDIEKQLDTKLSEYKSQLDAKQKVIDKAVQDIATAKEQITNAETNADAQALLSAKQSLELAEVTKQLNIKKLNDLGQEKPLSKSEYQELLKQINQLADTEQTGFNSQADTHIQALNDIVKQSLTAKQNTDKVLEKLQRAGGMENVSAPQYNNQTAVFNKTF